MRNKQEFEALVFEKADRIKAHDRNIRIIKASILPAAAAFVILTAVGINRLGTITDSAPSITAETAGQNEPENFAGSAYHDSYEKSAEAENGAEIGDYNDEYTEYSEDYTANYENEYEQNLDQYDDDEAQNNAAEEADISEDESLTFIANDEIAVTDKTAIAEIIAALSGEVITNEVKPHGYLGKIITESETEFMIYSDHISVVKNGIHIENRLLDDCAKTILEKYFPVKFQSITKRS